MTTDGRTNQNGASAALLTAPSPGGIAVIGVNGPHTRDILGRMLMAVRSDAPIAIDDAVPTLCRVVDGHAIIDDAIAVYMTRGKQFAAEICTHGGVRVVQRVLLALERAGAKIVEPARFSHVLRSTDAVSRAIDTEIIRTGSRRMLAWLMAQRRILPVFMSNLPNLSDEERSAFKARSQVATRLVRGIRIALVGPPNAGKSTLANRLIGADRILTSDTPGTTRDWVAEDALIDGWPVTLTDTAGLRGTGCKIEYEAIRRGREQARAADLIMLVLDSTQSVDAMKSQLAEIRDTLPTDRPMILVCNKCDQPDCAEMSSSGLPSCHVSAMTGTGISDLEVLACSALKLDLLTVDQPAAFFDIAAGEHG